MQTRCPDCQTIFRVTPEQLKARAGKVRCGQCQSVFNALDSLLEAPAAAALPGVAIPTTTPSQSVEPTAENEPVPTEIHEALEIPAAVIETPPPVEPEGLDADATQEFGKAAGLILPRDTTEIPGYSKWADGAVAAAPVAIPEEKKSRWPFALAAIVLTFGLAGQATFHYRSELAVAVPFLKPSLLAFSHALNRTLPLPTRAELVSIETSDLQTDTARGNLLVLNATLRNRAPYGQAYPWLELSLTDTQDSAIARRVFAPKEYLPAKVPADQPFAANSDFAVRLWIEANDIGAAGYRLYVFYP